MANADRKGGLIPVSYLNGAPWNGQARLYAIASEYDTALAIGDPVTLAGTGSPTGIPNIALATAGATNQVLGAIVGLGVTPYFSPNTNNLNQIIRPADTVGIGFALVVDDPQVIFEIQEGGEGTLLTPAALGGNFNLLSGTNNGYVSGWTLNNATTNNDATHQVQLIGAPQVPNNTLGEAYAKWYVRINVHQYKSGVAGL